MTSTHAPAPTDSASPAPASPPSARPYQAYVYAYPHKTAYRRLDPRPALREVWAGERTDALALYLHIPFCEVRCGFCNLFTRIGAPGGLTTAYLDALERQSGPVREALGERAQIATVAFGGGTPTFLEAAELDRLCDIAERRMGADLRAVPLSVETSPTTATADRLAVLAERGTTRLSIGVQTFVDAEARSAVRPQRRADVEAALGRIRERGFPILNIDLIYGIEGQTVASWTASLNAALAWEPEELYLYPLYVRPLTGLGRPSPGGTAPNGAASAGAASGSAASDEVPEADRDWDEQRLRLYRHGRDHLLARGYRQVSMRMFRRIDAPDASAADHACQVDGMVGLGCGARSYTSALHYSFDYAVDMRRIRALVDAYVGQGAAGFARAEYGRRIDGDEARRRHLVQSLLQAEGLDVAGYRSRFGEDPGERFAPELARFAALGWLEAGAPDGRLRLSPEGLAHSDAVGPALFSPAVRSAMAAYEPK